MQINISARSAVIEMLQACEALNEVTKIAVHHSKSGLPLPIDEDEYEFLVRTLALMRLSVETLAPVILETNHLIKVIKATPKKFVLHSV